MNRISLSRSRPLTCQGVVDNIHSHGGALNWVKVRPPVTYAAYARPVRILLCDACANGVSYEGNTISFLYHGLIVEAQYEPERN